MKKILKCFLLMIGLTIGFTLGATNVHASTLKMTDSGYWYERLKKDLSGYTSWHWTLYEVDGQVAYCIEPEVPEGTNYVQGTWADTGLSNSIKERLLLIGYYGYTYPNHQTLKYRGATQGMIWDAIIGNGSHTLYSTERWNAGTSFDVSSERAEIERLISHHYDKPSFDKSVHKLQVGESITLTDTNGVLGNYSVSVSGANYKVDGNNLTITPTKSGTININLTKNMPYNAEHKFFVGDGIQNMFVAGTVDPVISNVRINSYYSSVEITKKDVETNSTTPQGQATLKNAKYGVYEKSTGKLITTITTNESGYGKSDEVLSYNSYYLQEIDSSTGYLLDNNRYEFNLKGKEKESLNVYEKVIKNYISILKQYDYVNGNTTFLNAESNITFEIFYPNGDKYGEVTTDKNGYATLEIPYGIWKFHQVNTNTGFEKIYDFYITVDEKSELEQYYNILNNKISAYLKVVKKDSETGNTIALANTTFKILNTDTNQYVSQYVGGKVYSEFSTDETGTFTTFLKLEAGNYKLIEVSSPSGYLISKDGLSFTIGENTEYNYTTYGAIVVEEFKNDQIKGQVEIFKNGESFVVEDGTFRYEAISLSGIKYNLYADEDIKSSDGNYLYYNKGDLVEVLTTNKDGYAISKLLPLGKYFLVEAETKDNYILDTTEHHFSLTEKDNKTAVVYETHKQFNYLEKGTLVFTKTDLVDGTPIPNTLLQIFDDKDQMVFEGLTNEDGQIVIKDLFVGKYYIVEKNAVEGYVLNNEKVYFEIKDNGEIIKSEMTNKKITSTLKITKIDEEENKISGVKFGVFDLNGNLISEHITDENGYFEIELNYGKYYLKELSTLDQYLISDEKIYFEVKEDGAVIENIIINEFKKGTLEFTKVDLVDGTPIPNTLLQIFNDKDELIFEGLTDADGKIVIEDLKYGRYYIIEKEPNSNYQITDEKVFFEILEDGKVVKANMTNEKIIVEVPKTSIADSKVVTIITIGCIVAGIGFIIYEKKKKNKSRFNIIGSCLIVGALSIFAFYHIYNYSVNQAEEKMADEVINKPVEETPVINNENTNNNEETKENKQEIYNYIGVLEIPKINFKRGFLNIDDKNNTISKNIQVLEFSTMPDVDGGLMVIAGHSGSGRVAFFNKLDKLKVKDQIFIYYKNIKYVYEISKYYEEDKDGDIAIDKSNTSTLVLTACSQTNKNKQIVIDAKLIEKLDY